MAITWSLECFERRLLQKQQTYPHPYSLLCLRYGCWPSVVPYALNPYTQKAKGSWISEFRACWVYQSSFCLEFSANQDYLGRPCLESKQDTTKQNKKLMQCQQKMWLFSSLPYSPPAMDPEIEQHHLNFELPKRELNKPLYFLRSLCRVFHCSKEKKTEQADACKLAPAALTSEGRRHP